MKLNWYKKGNRRIHKRNFSVNNLTGGEVLECEFCRNNRNFIASYFPKLDKVEILDVTNNLVYTKDYSHSTDLNSINRLINDFIQGEDVSFYCYEC